MLHDVPRNGLYIQFCVSSSVHTTSVSSCSVAVPIMEDIALYRVSSCSALVLGKNLEKRIVGGVGKC